MKKTLRKNLPLIAIVTVALTVGIIVFLVMNSHLGRFNSEPITIDITEPIDVSSYLTGVKEGTEVTYDLDEENSKLTVNLTKGNKTETIEKDVTILYPRVEIKDDVTIDTYVGYDINELVDADEGVKLDSSLDKENSVLTVTYTKGEYTNTISKTVTVTSSDPKDNVRFYDCKNIRGVKYQMVIYPDGTLEEYETSSGNVYAGKWEMTDENNGELFEMINSPANWRMGIWFSDDSSEASFFIGNDRNKGNSSQDACTLTEVKPAGTVDKAY